MNKTANNPNQPPDPRRTPNNPPKSQPTPIFPTPTPYPTPSPTPPILQNKANLNIPLTPLNLCQTKT